MNPKSNIDEWYRFAEMYANTASFLLENHKTYDAICYISVLSAECAMKVFLLERSPEVPLPETHNLTELCQICARFEDSFSSLLEDCQALGRFTTPSGFPSFERASQEDAIHALKAAKAILSQTLEQTQGLTMTM